MVYQSVLSVCTSDCSVESNYQKNLIHTCFTRSGSTLFQVTPLFSALCSVCTVCISNCSLDENNIGPEGGVALGESLTVNQTLQTLR